MAWETRQVREEANFCSPFFTSLSPLLTNNNNIWAYRCTLCTPIMHRRPRERSQSFQPHQPPTAFTQFAKTPQPMS